MVPTARVGVEGAARAFGAYIRAQRQLSQFSLRELAELAHISNPYLSQIERGLHQPSVAVIRSLAEALNLSAEVLFAEAAGLQRAAGLSGGTPTPSGVETAIRGDDRLTQEQKGALLAVYRSMVSAS